MAFYIREAVEADIAAIVEIYRDAVLNGTATYELEVPAEGEMLARFTAIMAKGYPYIIAQAEDGTVLGYAYASAFRARPAYNWMVEDSIYLAPEARGQGIGRALLEALVERCTKLGFRQMTAVIGGASPASVGVHRACGFKMAGTLHATGFKHGQWLDTAFMELPLGEGAETLPDLETYPANLR